MSGPDLNEALLKIHAKRDHLLLGLERPEIPLHNNLSEGERRTTLGRLIRVLQKVYTAQPRIYRENLSGYTTGFYGATNCKWFIGLTGYGSGIEEDLVRQWLIWGYEENMKLTEKLGELVCPI